MSREQPDFWAWSAQILGGREHQILITSDSHHVFWECTCRRKRKVEFTNLDLAEHEWFMHMMDRGGN